MATILAHLSPFPGGLWGFAHTVPRWKMQSGPRVCFHILIAYFDLWHSPRDFFCRGMGFAMPGDRAAVSHPPRCETHALLTPTVMPHRFQSLSEIRTGRSQMVRQTLVSVPTLVPCSLLCSKSSCFSSLWTPSSSECLQKLFAPWRVWTLLPVAGLWQLVPSPSLSTRFIRVQYSCHVALGPRVFNHPVT